MFVASLYILFLTPLFSFLPFAVLAALATRPSLGAMSFVEVQEDVLLGRRFLLSLCVKKTKISPAWTRQFVTFLVVIMKLQQ